MTPRAPLAAREVVVGLASPDARLVDRLRGAVRAPMRVGVVAGDAGEVVRLARREPMDLVLLDSRLPGGVVQATRRVADEGLGAVVVVTTADDADESLMLRVLRAGAVGLLPASTPVDRLASAMNGVLRGEAALPRAHVRVLLAEFHARPGRSVSVSGRRVHLTRRELEVLQLLRLQHSTTSIAHRLGIADTTVRTHVAGLQRKARVSSRGELLATLTG